MFNAAKLWNCPTDKLKSGENKNTFKGENVRKFFSKKMLVADFDKVFRPGHVNPFFWRI